LSEDVTDQSAPRRAKLAARRERGQAYPNDFRPDAQAGALHERFADADAEALALASERVQPYLDGGAPRRVIARPPKLVNVVA